jgi:hypothetical protein
MPLLVDSDSRTSAASASSGALDCEAKGAKFGPSLLPPAGSHSVGDVFESLTSLGGYAGAAGRSSIFASICRA